MKNKPIIVPVASGKGGVGKTVISVNLAFALAQLGKKVILIDLDFGGANIHTTLGYETAPDGVGNFLNQRHMKLEDYVLDTTDKNLKIIPGDAEMVGIANITNVQKKKLINQLFNLDAEYIILDLGAGSTFHTIDFFMISPFSILVTMPEMTSVLNAYALLKNSLFRLLYINLKNHPEVNELFNKHMRKGGESAWKISEILDKIEEIDPEIHVNASALVDTFNPKLIVNMATQPKDVQMGEKLRKISKSYLSIEMEYLGFLYHDKQIHQSIIDRVPIAMLSPDNQTYQTIVRMAYKIVNARCLPYFLLDIDNYDDSFEMIMEEATDDLASLIQDYENLTGENLVNINELLSIIKNLEYENIELKRKVERLEKRIIQYKKAISRK
ncbi:MAG: AAA family ATPase [Spirochaetes bacterium]|nr:AAA family ATPase [Spirochaetota bacterium]